VSDRRDPGTGDLVALAVIVALGGSAALVWLWGGLAGTLFGSGWPPLAASQLLGVLTRLPAHVADPARAWPLGARSRLPGPGGAYAALALIGSAILTPALIGLRAGFRSRWLRARSGARWARSRELRALRVRRGAGHLPRTRRSPLAAGAPGARLALGRVGGRLLHAEQRHALVAFGPPQSGKSAGLAVPALLEWEGPAVASSIKTDLLEATVARRRQLGEVLIFDPLALSRERSHSWSPLHTAHTWEGAIEAAWRLAAAGELDQRGVEGGDFWAIAAEQRLAPLLHAAAAAGAQMDAVVRWAHGHDTRALRDGLQRQIDTAGGGEALAGARAAYDAARAFEAQAERTRASIEGTAQAILRGYRIARVARCARSTEITADTLLAGPNTLYVVGDAKASKLLRPIFVALISEIVDRAYERATLNGGGLERPLLLCLDEAGNVAPLPNLAEIASTAPSHNIQLVSIFHDLAQARSRYGQQAETVVNSHRARLLLPGVADLDTLRYFSGLVGDADVRDFTRTTGASGASRSVARRPRPLAAPEHLRQLPEGHALMVYGRVAPALVRLRLWFEDRHLRRLARC
jgi:type IV secretion system protein VirD4